LYAAHSAASSLRLADQVARKRGLSLKILNIRFPKPFRDVHPEDNHSVGIVVRGLTKLVCRQHYGAASVSGQVHPAGTKNLPIGSLAADVPNDDSDLFVPHDLIVHDEKEQNTQRCLPARTECIIR